VAETTARSIETVLAVDDDETVLAALSRAFGRRRTVFTASNPTTARSIARKQRPDLAIIDMRIGSASGIDLVRTLKAELPNTVVALVSGYLSVESTVLAVRAGADVIMSKPCTAKDILRRIESGMPTEPDLGETPTLARAQIEHIDRVMSDCHGNVSEAARRLGIYRSSLQRRLRKQSPRA
jgi:two-component system, response regulator RegA